MSLTYRLTGAAVDFRVPEAILLAYTVDGEHPQDGSVTFSTTFISADGDLSSNWASSSPTGE